MRMKSLILSGLLAALAGPALAATDWHADLGAEAQQTPVRVDEVRLGAELAEHVEDIGARDLDRLLTELREDVEARLAERGLLAEPGEPAAELDLVLVEATPNRPTFAQLGGRGEWGWDRPGVRQPLSRHLSLASFGIGKVKLEGVFTGADGAPLGEVTYRYEESDIYQAQFAATWTDVHRGIDMFANRLARTLAD